MDRRSFSAVLDESVRQLETDVRVLKTQQVTITANLKELEIMRDKLSQEIMDNEQKLSKVKQEYKNEVDTMMKSAQEKLNKASEKEAEASIKLAELNERLKEADNIVKSNQGLQKNLNNQSDDIRDKIVKLKALINLIENTIKDM